MPKRKVPAKSPARGRQRQLSEWKLLGRYLRQMTGHDLDNYARLVGVLKERELCGRLGDEVDQAAW
jgi:hypothetical protein